MIYCQGASVVYHLVPLLNTTPPYHQRRSKRSRCHSITCLGTSYAGIVYHPFVQQSLIPLCATEMYEQHVLPLCATYLSLLCTTTLYHLSTSIVVHDCIPPRESSATTKHHPAVSRPYTTIICHLPPVYTSTTSHHCIVGTVPPTVQRASGIYHGGTYPWGAAGLSP